MNAHALTHEKPAPGALVRWTVLVLISFAMMGNYYIYDSISPLADVLISQLGFGKSDIGLLQSIYSFPNIIMVFLGGIIIDRIGTRKSVLLFTTFVMMGAVVTALQGNVWTMAAGRLIFGLGAESMIVAITTVIARWFKGKELSLAFGLNLTVARLGSFLALNSPSWGKSLYSYWQSPLLVTVAAGVFAVISIGAFYILDARAYKKYSMPQDGAQDKIVFSEMFKFGAAFWFISALCVTFYSAMFPFQTFAVTFFQDAHGTSREVGGLLSSLLTLAAMIFTPLFGLMSDKIGKGRAIMMMFGSLLIIPVYLMMAYQFGKPDVLTSGDFIHLNLEFFGLVGDLPIYLLPPMLMMGIAFSLVPAVMWPFVSLVVPSQKLGTAYGLMTMIQNIGLFGFNLIIGFTNDSFGAGAGNPQGYTPGMWIFTSLGFFGLVFALLLSRYEKKAVEKQAGS
ncbi:MAG: MFS transporter [Chloroflexota bacterium]